MERTEEQKEQLLQDLWYKRNPSHDKDNNGVDRFWGTALCVFEDYKLALTLPVVMQSLPKRLSNAAYLNAREMRYEDFVTWWDEQV